MKIVYCLVDSSSAGGIQRSICNKANYLADELGYDITIVTTDRRNRQNFYDFSPNIKFIDLQINYFQLERLPFFEKVVNHLKKRKIHRQKLKDVLLTLRPDITISTYSHEFTILCKIKDGSKKIAEHHFNKSFVKITYEQESLFSLKRLFALTVEMTKQSYIRKYDAFVVLTHSTRQLWKNFHNIHVIPNILPFYPSRFSNVKHKRMISVGRLAYQKGYPLLIKAWSKIARKYPDWRLDIYGEGADYKNLVRLISSSRLSDSVEIHSSVRNIEEEYIHSSFYVMSSLYEGFGLVLIEAMACGLPCVSFDCPNGPAEIIANGEDGLLIEYKNIDKLVEAMSLLIEDEVLRTEMGENARLSSEKYLPEKIMPRWISLFEQVTGTSNY